MLTYFLYFLVFIAAIFVFELIVAQLRTRGVTKRAANRRMRLLDESKNVSEVEDIIRQERGLGGSLFQGEDALLRNLHVQSGITVTPANLLGLSVLAGLGAVLVTSFFLSTLWVKAVGFFATVFAVPIATLIVMRRRRIARFTRQLPDALDIIVRSLRAGHPFSTAITLVAREMPDPIGSEFGILSDEVAYGIDLDTALANLGRRVGAEDIRFLSISLNIHRTSGGNLAEVLANLSRVIRNRFLVKAKIRALSAEGRFSAKLMSVWPLILYFVLQILAPEYYDPIYEAGIEVPFYTFCIVTTIIGNIVLTKMVNFDF